MNKKENKKCNFLKYLLIILVIICSIFKNKTIYIEPNEILEISISNIIYPLTFLISIILLNKTSFKETHKTIINIIIIYLLFNVFVTLLNSIPGNYYSTAIDLSLKQILTPNHFMIFKYPIYYPNLLNIISYISLFYFSHTLIIILYDAMKPYTNRFLAYMLSMFIPFTLDVMCYITINDVYKEIEFNKLIIDLTSNFVIVIISTLLLSIIHSIKKVSSKASTKA